VIGAIDPNPKHAGRGIRLLRRAGLSVKTGVLGREATALNRPFNHWITTGRAWVTAKAAMTLDGKIATRTGESKWITNKASRRQAHAIRAESDAVLVGVNTVLRDNPRLTVRKPRIGGKRSRPLLRIVLDPKARTPARARVLHGAEPTLIVASRSAPRARVGRLLRAGALVWRMPAPGGRFPLKPLLARLGRNEITSLLVEGGADTLGAFFDAKLVNRLCFFYAPKIIGGAGAVKAVGGHGVRRMKDAPVFEDFELRRFGDDLLITAYV
jgi:diaminohydroxyphosphoribosylaminopyrimidine deaminase/5-amino-6-(5-phosphoribosylamino)uracil reductase